MRIEDLLRKVARVRWESRRLPAMGLSCAMLVTLTGCPPPATEFLDPLPQREAVAVVNDNIGRIKGTLRASGPLGGYFRSPQGNRRNFDVDGTLFFLAPKNMRLDLKALGGTQVLFGSNAERFWYYSKQDGDYYLSRRHESLAQLDGPIPISPTQIIEALGLTPIPSAGGDPETSGPMQRIYEDYQILFFAVRGESGQPMLQKEYWLDRRDPRLVRRVVFLDADGDVEMESVLSGYAALGEGGPLLPGEIEVNWPKAESFLRFRIRKWELYEGIDSKSPQFIPPHELGIEYERMDVDDGS